MRPFTPPRLPGAPEIKGWCPGALRPMPSGDGLLLRAKAIGPRLTAEQAQEIAAISSWCGNGLVDLSQRAQLQLRGIGETSLQPALSRLERIGLLARDIATESVLNFIAPPLAGLDESALVDTWDILARFVGEMTDRSLHALPGKFGFLVDDGGALGLANVTTDIRLEACRESGETRIAVVADGARDSAFIVPAERAVETAIVLARAFLSLRREREFELRRMRFLVRELGVAALAREAGLKPVPYRSTRPATRASRIFGAQTAGRCRFAGIGAANGRWRASDIAFLGALAASDGIGELRLTPWRAILLPCASEDAAREMTRIAAGRDLVVDADDPRLAIVACPGAPECPQAGGETRTHEIRLAPLARRLTPEGVGLHISGCAKGCAMPSPAPVTLVVRDTGFDLVDNGRACDASSLTGLGVDEAEEALRARILAGNHPSPSCRGGGDAAVSKHAGEEEPI